ncbi:MAG TPA: TonB-dependent receptor [Crocinitomix sp.]|nr:TonB-dependent receptor [Crocinitomix sp.]
MKTAIVCIFIFIVQVSYAQSRQTVRGVIKETFTEMPIEGVVVKLLDGNETKGETISNANGEFEFKNVQLGHYDILFKHINYKSFILPSINVSVSKETVLEVTMRALPKQLKMVEVNPVKERGTPNNEMSVSSVFSIHPNDAKRIAGGLDDPIRVAGTLPGVTSATGFSANFISIRGNSPRSLKYYMAGIELPNPTHFARIGSSGGTFTIFNLDLLDKSDFYTAAFTAQYGNSVGGVFDVKFRSGNTQKHEFNLQVGTLGANFGAEGPLSKKHKASYIFNYRYATVSLGRVSNPSTPTYQDLNFNITVPLKRNAKLQFFAISGMSDRTREGISDSTKWTQSLDRTTLYLASSTATLGTTYKKYINSNNVFNMALIGAYTKQADNKDYIQDDYSILHQRINEYTSKPISASMSLKHKFGLRHKNITGLSFTSTYHQWMAEKYSFIDSTQYVLMDGNGRSNLFKVYSQSKISITEKFDVVAGIFYLMYDVNNKQSLEPRLSLNYKVNDRHSIAASFGKHSQVENYATYLYQTTIGANEIIYPNKNLDFVKAYHYVLSYKGKVFTNHLLRVEVYYQDLWNVPSDTGSFSTINLRELQDLRLLTNNGTGQNYGIDLGFERYTDNGLYYIFNTSIYRSLYTAGDGVKRSTAYDNKYNLKFIIGKEYKLKASVSKKNIEKYRAFSWNTNLNILGGQPYTPLDLNLSKLEQETVYNESLAFSEQGKTLVFLDFNFSYTINKKGRKTVWALQIKNLFSNGQAIFREYDTVANKEIEIKSTAFFPNIYYRLEF